jgi:hypothetical protein
MGSIHPISESASPVELAARVVRGRRDFCRPWHGCRELAAQCGFAPNEWPRLPRPAVRLPSFMSHSPALQFEVHRAWVRLLGPRIDRPIVILDAPMVDVASLSVVRDLAVHGEVVLYVEQETLRPDELHGGRTHDRGYTAVSVAFAAVGRGAPVNPKVQSIDALDRDAESALWNELVAGREVAAQTWFEMLTHCFDQQGFAAVLHFAEHLDRFVDELEAEQLACAHTLIGLSAYARHVETRASAAIGEFMAEHFSRALEHEPTCARRAALMQRMSIVEARRRGELGRAREWAERAIAEAEAGSGDAAEYAAAWSRNAHAFTLARMGELDRARREMAAAFAQLVEIAPASAELPRGEQALAELAFIDNRIELALLGNDHQAALALQEQLAQRERALTGHDDHASVRRIDLLARDLTRTDECAALASARAIRFRAVGDPINELHCVTRAAELAERRACASEAIAAHERALALGRELASQAACDRTQLRLALLRWRSGLAAQARAELEQLADVAVDPPTAAEALAVLARITAELHTRTAAEQIADRAIEAATEQGDSRTVLRVALWLIELCEVIGDRENAEQLAAEGRRILAEYPESITLGERCWLATAIGDPSLLPAELALERAFNEPELCWRRDAFAIVTLTATGPRA